MVHPHGRARPYSRSRVGSADQTISCRIRRAAASAAWWPAAPIGAFPASAPGVVPIPVFVHRATGEVLRDLDVVDRVANAFETEGRGCLVHLATVAFPRQRTRCQRLRTGHRHRRRVVRKRLDPRFHARSARPAWPADLYVEGSDQHRGWFQSSLLEASARAAPPRSRPFSVTALRSTRTARK